jgi:transcriptional regulator with XRE-family HTH domain
MELLNNIRRIRKAKKIKQEKMAELVNMATTNYGKLERGGIAITIDRLYKIAEILNVPVSELLGENESLVKEISTLKTKIENLEIRVFLTDSDKNKVEMALENWEELKTLRVIISSLELLDYANVEAFKKENGKYFQKSLEYPSLLFKEFTDFFARVGKNEAYRRIRKHLDIEKYEASDLIIQESKETGWSVEKIIDGIRKLQQKH